MTFFLTLVASDTKHPLKEASIVESLKILSAVNVTQAGQISWLSHEKAADIPISNTLDHNVINRLRGDLAQHRIDCFVTSAENRRKKLLLADMDSTIVTGETLDDLAEHASLKDKISAITARAMNGELDFHEALRERVGLLKGLPVDALQKTLDHTTLSAGAKTFVQTMTRHGATCVLVSGGFTFFTSPVANSAGFDHHHGNVLDIEDNALTGRVIPPILDKFAKVEFLEYYMKSLGLGPAECLTIGDGANDIPMLKAAGLGIGYHPKPAVIEEIDNVILYGDLTAALYAQGYTDQEFS